jgi:hypothetical protein
MDVFAERVFYCLVAADAALLVFLCGACLVAWRRRAAQEQVETPEAAEACPTSSSPRKS